MRKDNLLDLILTNKEGLVRETNVGGSLSFSDPEFINPTDMLNLMQKMLTMSQKYALFSALLGYISKDIANRSREVILSICTGEATPRVLQETYTGGDECSEGPSV